MSWSDLRVSRDVEHAVDSKLLWRPRYSKCLTSFIILMGKENCLSMASFPPKLSPTFLSSPPLSICSLVSCCLLNSYTSEIEGYGQACHSCLMGLKGIWAPGELGNLMLMLDGSLVAIWPSACPFISGAWSIWAGSLLGSPSLQHAEMQCQDFVIPRLGTAVLLGLLEAVLNVFAFRKLGPGPPRRIRLCGQFVWERLLRIL